MKIDTNLMFSLMSWSLAHNLSEIATNLSGFETSKYNILYESFAGWMEPFFIWGSGSDFASYSYG